MAANNQITMGYYYDTVSATWIENIITLPYTPYPQLFIILCGIILMIAFTVELQ
jgi:hypothetical protein